MATRFICIHGHFYQPPRENPWLGEVEMQPDANPFHDWNERITSECYTPNALARLTGNNYSRMSFNFGPTLLSWLERHHPFTYEKILEADEESKARFSGHGSALSQAYNHVILPLASLEDQATQVVWGIRDFQKRFKRFPEGMWLPETAVNLSVLEVLAKEGIRFTLLAPHQAARFRPIQSEISEVWEDVSGGQIHPRPPYRVCLPSGKQIVVFFYDGPLSHAIAFEDVLRDGDYFFNRMLQGFDSEESSPQLLHVAVDGETFGHHHTFGEMALAYVLRAAEESEIVSLTNYGEFLEKNPPQFEVEIVENTSWSCSHGLGRWKENCGCSSGTPGWNQTWRKGLRESLTWLKGELDQLFLTEGGKLFQDPLQTQRDYIEVILNREEKGVRSFLENHFRPPFTEEGRRLALLLLEMAHHGQLMFTSCGWFFDELSRVEGVQILKYACRAIQLATSFGSFLEPPFLERLKEAKSNLSLFGDGVGVYRALVLPPSDKL